MSDSGQEQRRITGNGNLVAPWKKGQSGNPSGRPKKQLMTADLWALSLTSPKGMSLSEAMAKKAFEMALKGNFQFWNAIMDRLDGKVVENLAADLHHTITLRHVEAELPRE